MLWKGITDGGATRCNCIGATYYASGWMGREEGPTASGSTKALWQFAIPTFALRGTRLHFVVLSCQVSEMHCFDPSPITSPPARTHALISFGTHPVIPSTVPIAQRHPSVTTIPARHRSNAPSPLPPPQESSCTVASRGTHSPRGLLHTDPACPCSLSIRSVLVAIHQDVSGGTASS